MASTIRVRAQANGPTTDVQALIQHPMDSGFVRDAAGTLIPAHHIETVTYEHNDRIVFTALWGPAVAKDPYVKFAFRGGAKGDALTVTWIDNFGRSDSIVGKIT